MFRFWGREIMGWVLIFLGLLVFYIVISLLLRRGPEIILDQWAYLVIGIFVFRGGIHLLKVAVAARIAQTPPEPEPPAVEPRKRKSETPWDW